jgi:hypothetical protein
VQKIVNLPAKPDDFGAALSEAYADYFACTINDDPAQGEYIVADAKGLRNLANDHRYPGQIKYPRTGKPEAHWTGLIWGGACWDLRQKLGPTVADQLVFRSIYYQPAEGSADFETAALGVLEADEMIYGGGHEETIRQVMSQRGILSATPGATPRPAESASSPSRWRATARPSATPSLRKSVAYCVRGLVTWRALGHLQNMMLQSSDRTQAQWKKGH